MSAQFMSIFDRFQMLAATAGLILLLANVAAPFATAGDLLFREHMINPDSEFIAAAATDVNHDEHLDIVCGAYWYEGPDWERHDVRDVKVYDGRPDGYAHLPMDVNGDGWIDILTANWRSEEVQWIEHPGGSLGRWRTHVIAKPGNIETGRLEDVDGDGRLDLLPNGRKFAAWWSLEPHSTEASSGESPRQPAWQRHELPLGLGGHGLGCGDIDGDGRADVVGQFGWASAPEHPRTQPWRFYDDFALDRASVPIVVADVDDDGDNDLVWCRAHDFGVYWSEQLGTAEGGKRWMHHVIDSSWSGAHSPLWADMDGDGRNELVVGKRYLSHEGKDPGEYDPQQGYRYQFDPETRTWRRWTLSYNQGIGYGLDPKAVDLDADGDLDLLLGGRNGLVWLENAGPPSDASEPADRASATLDDLLAFRDQQGIERPVETPFDWGQRRAAIVATLTDAIGPLPDPHRRVPLDVLQAAGPDGDDYRSERISFRVSGTQRATAILVAPRRIVGQAPAVAMSAEAGSIELARALARRGIVCLLHESAPTLTDEGEAADAAPHPSQLMRAIWTHVRAIDLLDVRQDVDPLKIAIVGQGDASAIALLTAALDQRINAVVLDGGSPLEFGARSDDAELLATVAPRPLLVQVAADVSAEHREATRKAVEDAGRVYQFRDAGDALQFELPPSAGADNAEAREALVDWLADVLRP